MRISNYKITASDTIKDPVFWHFYIILCIFALFSVFYYLGEILSFFGLDVSEITIFYTVHDFHRLLFLVPIIYAARIFRLRGAIITSVSSYLVFLPRSLFISIYPDSLLRASVFGVLALTIGIIVAFASNTYDFMKQMEQRMHKERDMFYAILQRMKDGVIIIDSSYVIRYLNPVMISEFGEGVNKLCYKYLHNFDDPCTGFCRLNDVISGRTVRWDYTFADGRTYDVIASPFVDESGKVSELAIFRNITERKQFELELKKLNQLKSDLLSNVSHELRTPLTSIKGIISSLLQKDINWDNNTRDMLLCGISEETDRLSSLVTNLLNMSKLEAGFWQPQMENCHLDELLYDTVDHQKWIYKNHVFKLYVDSNLPEVCIDRNQIKQVIINLLENATAYSKEGTEIEIHAKQFEDNVRVIVKDHGIGISELEIDNIFDKFYRGSQSRLRPGGIGLGLSICKAIIESHGGRIGVVSQIGEGSSFYFDLPVNKNEHTTK